MKNLQWIKSTRLMSRAYAYSLHEPSFCAWSHWTVNFSVFHVAFFKIAKENLKT